MTDAPHLSPVYKEYEDGKHRRYELLFKVNGAAFAIVAFATNKDTMEFAGKVLSLRTLAFGMIMFTLAMGADMFAFGWGMKQFYPTEKKISYAWLKTEDTVTPFKKGLFRPVGMCVLVFIVALIAVGWGLVWANAPAPR